MRARPKPANGKPRIGLYDTQEAARAPSAAIRRVGLVGKRRTNPVVDGQLVPREPADEKAPPRGGRHAAPPPEDTEAALRSASSASFDENRELRRR